MYSMSNVVARVRFDLLGRFQLFQIVDELFDVRLICREIDRFRDAPRVAGLRELDAALVGVGDLDLVDVVRPFDVRHVDGLVRDDADFLIGLHLLVDREAEHREKRCAHTDFLRSVHEFLDFVFKRG